MFNHSVISKTKRLALMSLVVGNCLIFQASAQSNRIPSNGANPNVSKAGAAVTSYRNRRPLPQRASAYYDVVWGVDSLSVRSTESGEVIRFSWRVLDPNKAAALNDKKAEPALNDPKAGVSLVVPSMEQVGVLRQSSTPEAGKAYWMAFSNKGRKVKPGDRVNVVIGKFHADGLLVD